MAQCPPKYATDMNIKGKKVEFVFINRVWNFQTKSLHLWVVLFLLENQQIIFLYRKKTTKRIDENFRTYHNFFLLKLAVVENQRLWR